MSTSTSIEWTDATWSPLRARRRDTGKVGQHCERVSPGCTNCYAATHNRRNLPNGGTGLDYVRGSRDLVETFVDERVLGEPLRWRDGKRIFPCNQTDLFADFYTDEQIDSALAVMAITPRHTYQIVTKRPQRMRSHMTRSANAAEWTQRQRDSWDDARRTLYENARSEGRSRLAEQIGVLGASPRWPLPNVWLGVTAEDQQRADERVPILLDTPAALRFVSVEPLLGPVNLAQGERMSDRDWLTRRSNMHLRGDVVGMLRNKSFRGCSDGKGNALSIRDVQLELERLRDAGVKFIPIGEGCVGFDPQNGCPSHRTPTLDWVIVGGESGAKARACDVAWIRSIVEQCKAAGVPAFTKQLGTFAVWNQCGLVANNPPVPHSRVFVEGREMRRLHVSKKGGELAEFPADLRVRELPEVRAC